MQPGNEQQEQQQQLQQCDGKSCQFIDTMFMSICTVCGADDFNPTGDPYDEQRQPKQ